MMEELFEKGCRSPFLYLEAWNYISSDTTLLHRMSSFWTQVFLFAGEKGLLTEELVMRFAYLTGYEREFCTSMYRALAMGYDALNPMIRWKQSADISCLEIRENRNISDGFPWQWRKGSV